MKLYRTTVYVDALEGADVICTPPGSMPRHAA
jgi:hypothetical protein